LATHRFFSSFRDYDSC